MWICSTICILRFPFFLYFSFILFHFSSIFLKFLHLYLSTWLILTLLNRCFSFSLTCCISFFLFSCFPLLHQLHNFLSILKVFLHFNFFSFHPWKHYLFCYSSTSKKATKVPDAWQEKKTAWQPLMKIFFLSNWLKPE